MSCYLKCAISGLPLSNGDHVAVLILHAQDTAAAFVGGLDARWKPCAPVIWGRYGEYTVHPDPAYALDLRVFEPHDVGEDVSDFFQRVMGDGVTYEGQPVALAVVLASVWKALVRAEWRVAKNTKRATDDEYVLLQSALDRIHYTWAPSDMAGQATGNGQHVRFHLMVAQIAAERLALWEMPDCYRD